MSRSVAQPPDDFLAGDLASAGEAETLNAVALDLVSELDLEALIQKATDAGRSLTGAAFAAFFHNQVDEEGETYLLYALSGVAREAFERLGVPRNTPLFAPSFRGEGSVRIADVLADPRYGKNPPHNGMPKGHLPVRSYMAVPVVSRRGEVIGTMFFGHPEPAVFTERAERLAKGAAALTAVAVDNARLHQATQQDLKERRQAEAALRESERRLNQLVSLMPAAVYACDLEGRITQYNRRAAEIWGREPRLGDLDERFCGSYRLWRLDGTPLSHAETPMAVAVREGRPARNEEVVIERPDGVRVTVIVNIDPIVNEQGERVGAINVFQDVTERKASEEARRRSEAAHAKLLASLPVAVYVCDAQGRLELFNDAAVALWGRKPDVARDRWCGAQRLFRPDGGPLAKEDCFMAQTVLRRRAIRGEEVVIERPDGSRRRVLPHPEPIFDQFGRVVGAINVLVDVTERREADRTRALLAAIVSSSEDAIISKTMDGAITSWNAGAERMFGYTAEEAIGQPAQMLVPPERWHEVEQVRTSLLCGERVELETVRLRKDGRKVHVSAVISPLRDETGEVIGASGVVRDISARKRSEETQALLASIVASSDDAIISKTLDGRITSWNAGAERLYGYTAAEVAGQPISILVPADRLQEEREIVDRLLGGERIEHFETVRMRRDGRPVDVSLTVSPVLDSAGHVIGASNVSRDITARKRQEEALRRSEERLRVAMQAGRVGVWEWDVASGAVTWTDSLYLIHGVERESFEPSLESFRSLVHPEDLARVEEAIQRSLEDDAPYELELRAVKPDGSTAWLFTSASLLREKGRPRKMLGATVDVTELKRAEARIAGLNEQLQRQVHELETLLNVLPIGVFIAHDRACERITANPAGAALLRLPAPDANASKTGAPEDRERLRFRVMRDGVEVASEDLPMQRAARTGEVVRGEECDLVFDDGTTARLYEFATPLLDAYGRARGSVGVFVDITERKHHEERMRLVMGELNHRVKNTLAVVDATAQQTLRHTPDIKSFAEAFGARLRALALAHSLLTQTEWEGAELRELVLTELKPRVADDSQLELSGPEVVLRPNAALALHMAVHELSTNAAKYGALSAAQGRVSLEWRIEKGQEGPEFELTWSESGGPPVSEPTRRGFGTRVLERTVAHELDGSVRMEYLERGVRCVVRFPWTGRIGFIAGGRR